MGKIVLEFETLYDVGDVVIFQKRDRLQVGIIEGYYRDCDTIWYNIRISPNFVYTYSNNGDIAEYDIAGKVNGELKDICLNMISKIC